MNWDAIGAIAELLGAIGVIASLVYLATQIRQSREQMSQNTQAMRASGYQSFFQNMDEVAMRSTSSPEMAQSVRLGLTDLDQLTEEQAFYFTMRRQICRSLTSATASDGPIRPWALTTRTRKKGPNR
jgi:hypothetical protein